MLETIKSYINTLPNKSFNQFYVEYIFSVDEEISSAEQQYLKRHGLLGIDSIGRLLAQIQERISNI